MTKRYEFRQANGWDMDTDGDVRAHRKPKPQPVRAAQPTQVAMTPYARGQVKLAIQVFYWLRGLAVAGRQRLREKQAQARREAQFVGQLTARNAVGLINWFVALAGQVKQQHKQADFEQRQRWAAGRAVIAMAQGLCGLAMIGQRRLDDAAKALAEIEETAARVAARREAKNAKDRARRLRIKMEAEAAAKAEADRLVAEDRAKQVAHLWVQSVPYLINWLNDKAAQGAQILASKARAAAMQAHRDAKAARLKRDLELNRKLMAQRGQNGAAGNPTVH